MQARLVNMDLTPVQGIDDMLVDIHTKNVDSMRGKCGRCGEANIAKSDDTDFLKIHWDSKMFDLEVILYDQLLVSL